MTLDVHQRVAAGRRRVRLLAGAAICALVVAGSLVMSRSHGDGAGEPSAGSTTAPAAARTAEQAAEPDAARVESPATPADNRVPQRRIIEEPAGAGPEEARGTAGSAAVDSEPALPPPAAPQGGSGTAEMDAFAAPERRVVLPVGTEQVDEYPVKFPYTPEGAAAAAVAMTRFSATLDYAIANEVMRLYASGESADEAAQTATDSVQAARQRLGLPATGPAPAEAAVVAEPVGVTWQILTDRQVRVSVETVAEYWLDNVITSRELVAATSVLAWDESAGDWKLIPTPADQTAGPGMGELGTREFNDAGWSAIAEEHP